MIESVAQLMDLSQASLVGIILVFARVGGVMSLLPAFGEQTIPMRVRLGVTIAFTMIVWPMVAPGLLAPPPERPFAGMLIVEGSIGVLLGLSIRLMVMGLQVAGQIAAQSTSLSQMAGPGVAPDPMPAIASLLTMAAMTLAVAMGLHVKAAIAMARSYEILPMGLPLPPSDVARWGVARVSSAFALGFTLAAPFVLAGFAYNLALGVINRAMPQLMVSMIGAPAITGAAILLLMLAAPLMLHHWIGRLDTVLASPLAIPK